jgi:hypothetical protein
MSINQILETIDAEIAILEHGRAALADITKTTATPAAPTPNKRRTMSAAGRKRIAEAQKKRWALLKKKTA